MLVSRHHSGIAVSSVMSMNFGSGSNSLKLLRGVEIACWALGITLLGLYFGVRTHAVLASEQGLEAFEEARLTIAAKAVQREQSNVLADQLESIWAVPAPDQSSWSGGRITAYQESLRQDTDLPEAVLRIHSIDLIVPVYTGANELNLNRGVARVLGTTPFGERGNVGIAGHRDGYFRGLKDATVGDLIEVQTLAGSLTYRISDFMVVEPADVHVLAPTEEHTITLVTCYPFYFVGHAPQRYIVRAELTEMTGIHAGGT